MLLYKFIYKIMVVYSLFLHGELNILYVIECKINYFNTKSNSSASLETTADHDMYDTLPFECAYIKWSIRSIYQERVYVQKKKQKRLWNFNTNFDYLISFKACDNYWCSNSARYKNTFFNVTSHNTRMEYSDIVYIHAAIQR